MIVGAGYELETALLVVQLGIGGFGTHGLLVHRWLCQNLHMVLC
jgi:hypothetical protein